MIIFTTESVSVGSGKYPSIQLYDAQACVYAGTSFAMSSGSPAMVICNGIEESLRACAGALTPWGDKIPVFILCLIHKKDIKVIEDSFSAVSRKIYRCYSINDIDSIPENFSDFPVIILISQDIPLEDLLPELIQSKIQSEKGIKHEKIKEIISEIERAQKPVVLAGRGCAELIEKAVEFAERINAPLLLTAGATTMQVDRIDFLRATRYPVIPSGNPVWLNVFMSADLIIALGSGLSEVDWFGLKDTKIYKGRILNISNEYTSQGVDGIKVNVDLGEFFSEARKAYNLHARKFTDSVMIKINKYRNALKDAIDKIKVTSPLHPSPVAYEIVNKSPEDTIFVSEGGACGMWLWMHLWLRPFVFPVQNGTIGVSIPMAIGAKCAFPKRNVWAVMGDGAFFYNVSELISMKRQGINAVIFVFNDASWGAIRLAQTYIYRENYPGTDINDIDYAEIAEIYGMEGITVRNYEDLMHAIDYVKDKNRTFVIDVKIRRDCVPVAGANFVISEFDGVLKWLLPGLIASSVKNILHKKIPFDAFRIIRKTLI